MSHEFEQQSFNLVPLPFGKFQPREKVVDGLMVSARMVDNFHKSRCQNYPDDELSQKLRRVHSVATDETLALEEKRQMVASIFDLP